MLQATNAGMIERRSNHSVDETVDRLKGLSMVAADSHGTDR